MTTSHLRRALVALTAMTVLAVGGCGDDEPAAQSPSSPSASASSPSPSEKEPRPGKDTSPPAPVDEVVVDVTIAGGEVTPVAQEVQLGVGETLLLEVSSDRGGELHVHSAPEQFADFEAGASRLDFTFDKPGSVDVEEHASGALVVRVLVR